MPPPTQAAEEIGAMIDAAALRPDLWPGIVEALREALPGTRTLLQAMDAQGGEAVPMSHSGWPGSCVEDFVAHYRFVNPWNPVLLGARPGRVLWTEELLPASAFRRTAFHADWLSRVGEADAASGIKVLDAEGRCGLVLVHYDARRADAAQAAAAPLLAALAPRMRRALDTLRLGGLATAAAPDLPLLQGLTDPALVLDGSLRLHAANPAAEALAASGRGLRVGCGDRVALADPGSMAVLAEAVAAILPGPGLPARPAPGGRAVRLGGDRFALTALPISPPMRALVGIGPVLLPRTLALIVLCPFPRLDDAGVAALLKARYRLTPAETRLALLLDAGMSLGEAAARCGVTYETARCQARAIYGKCDARGQSGVIRLVAGLREGG